MEEVVIAVPGQLIGTTDSLLAGRGCYCLGSEIRASMCGKVIIQPDPASEKSFANILSAKSVSADDCVVNIGDIVVCRVQKISSNQATVEIISVGENVIKINPPKGTIRKEDVRMNEVDTIVMHECYRHGDLVRAEVISLGDARQYFLTTAAVEYGVLRAKSEAGNVMNPVSWKASRYNGSKSLYILEN